MIFENKCYKLRKCEDTYIDEKNQQRMEKPWHLYLNVSLKTPVLTKFVYAANNNTLWGKKNKCSPGKNRNCLSSNVRLLLKCTGEC